MTKRETYECYIERTKSLYGAKLESPRWEFCGWCERPNDKFLQKETKLFWIYDMGDWREKYRKPTK